MREEFIKRVVAEEASKSALCREYGISRPTGSKWITRYQAGQQLEDRRRPIQRPGKTPAEVEALVIEYRKRHPQSVQRRLGKSYSNHQE